MIKINVLSPMNKNVAAALAAIRARPYSGRNPQLGKMINCDLCGNRHRQVRLFAARTATKTDGTEIVIEQSSSVCKATYAPQRLVEGAKVSNRYSVKIAGLQGDKVVEGEPMMASQLKLKGIFGAAMVAKKRIKPHLSKWKRQLVQLTQQLYPQNEPYITNPQECMEESRKQAARILKDKRAGIRRPPVSTETRNKRQDKQAKRTAANAAAREALSGSSPS
jgi:hypothetical protein